MKLKFCLSSGGMWLLILTIAWIIAAIFLDYKDIYVWFVLAMFFVAVSIRTIFREYDHYVRIQEADPVEDNQC